MVVDDLLPAVGEVDVVDALGVLALALLLVPEVHAVLRVHLVTEAVVRRAEIGMDSIASFTNFEHLLAITWSATECRTGIGGETKQAGATEMALPGSARLLFSFSQFPEQDPDAQLGNFRQLQFKRL